MPSSKEHKAKADLNRAFVDSVKDNLAFSDWVAVAAFYAAMHLIERLCAKENTHHISHNSRNAWVNRHLGYSDTQIAFSALYDASRIARHGTLNQFNKAYPGDKVQRLLVDDHLAKIESYVAASFSAPSWSGS